MKAEDVKKLREQTGVGMMDCKKALQEADGDFAKAVDLLRKKGLAAVAKKEGRTASEGLIGTYNHNGRIGVLIEVNCETDFVAKNDDFKNFVKEMAMQVAAANPKFVNAADMDEQFLAKEREIYTAQLKEQGKPEKMIPNIVEGKVRKLAEEVCLMEQPFIKDNDKKVKDLITDLTLKIGEKITIRRFIKYNLGEGLEKRKDDLAQEISKMTS